MKKTLLICSLTVFCFLQNFATGNPAAGNDTSSIIVEKKISDRSHRISLYPDLAQKVLFFSVKGREGKAYQLYVFDLEGKLVKQTEIRNKQTTLIKNMEKGVYLFEVFSNDDRIGNGQITVR